MGPSIQLVGIPPNPPASGICLECKSRVCSHVKPLRRPLTPREVSIIRLMAGGLGNKEIGALLGIREGTIKTRNTHIFDKLGVRSRFEVISWALQNASLVGLHGTMGRTA
jgi:DNA-binding NarL/FixJ family response regulator